MAVKYSAKEHNEVAKNAAIMGLTIPELGELIGISRSGIFNWFNQYPDFKEAYRSHKHIADERVQDCLYELATTSQKKITTKIVTNKRTGDIIETVETVETPPSYQAICTWLFNRTQDWKPASQYTISNIEIDKEMQHKVSFSVVTPDSIGKDQSGS